jgi:hypothetical protein
MAVINFTKEKRLILAGIIIVLFQMVILSIKIRSKRINKLKLQVNDFNLDEGK